MSLEINVNNRTANVELLERDGNNIRISLDGKEYKTDIEVLENGVYSILLNGISYDVRVLQHDNNKHYNVNLKRHSFDVEIVDAESKYKNNRSKGDAEENENIIFSPMPGKIVKILVKEGTHVKAGQTVVIIEAMKMQSEYKVKKDGVIEKIKVKEGDTVDANQTLIVVK